jgi:hypothetical protein
MRIDSYKLDSNHMMKQHMRLMSSMIRELKATENHLTNEQQVQVVIDSLPISLETISQLMYNENIKTFDDVSCHLELEFEHLEAAKPNSSTYLVELSLHMAFTPKRKNNDKQGATRPAPNKVRTIKRKRGKHAGREDKSKVVCFHCRKESQFARE